MDGVVSPDDRGSVGKLGGLGVLNLEGIWTRYEDPDAELERIAAQPKELATTEMQRIYAEPIKEHLIGQRIREIKEQGVVAAASLTPQRVRKYYETALEAGLDILVIQGTVISAEHVSANSEPLNLKEFIREVPVPVIVGGCASYATGLHLMRTGAVGGARGRWPRRGVHHAWRARDRRAAGHRDRGRGRCPLAAHARDRRVREGDRRRRHAQRR